MGVVRAPGRGTAVEKCKRQKVQKLGGANARGLNNGPQNSEDPRTFPHGIETHGIRMDPRINEPYILEGLNLVSNVMFLSAT